MWVQLGVVPGVARLPREIYPNHITTYTVGGEKHQVPVRAISVGHCCQQEHGLRSGYRL